MPESAGQHDRLMVTADLGAGGSGDLLAVRTEIACQIGPAELVVERRAADRALEHDFEGRGNARRLTRIDLPGLRRVRQQKIRDRKTAQPSLRFAAAPCCPFVPDLTAGTRRRAREGRDRSRMIVRLDLHQDRRCFIVLCVTSRDRVRLEAAAIAARDDRCVVVISGQDAVRGDPRRVPDHREERGLLGFTVDRPFGVENLVPTVFRVGLSEHHQFDVCRVSIEVAEAGDEIVDLVGRQSEAEVSIRFADCFRAARENIHGSKSLGLCMAEEGIRLGKIRKQAFGHPVMEFTREEECVFGCAPSSESVHDSTLDSIDDVESAAVKDLGRLRGPGGNRPESRDGDQLDGVRGPWASRFRFV